MMFIVKRSVDFVRAVVNAINGLCFAMSATAGVIIGLCVAAKIAVNLYAVLATIVAAAIADPAGEEMMSIVGAAISMVIVFGLDMAPPPPRPRRMLKIAVEGNIGVGKSTILRALENMLAAQIGRVETIEEPVDAWKNVGGHNPLEAFYGDKERFAFSFQSLALTSRLRTCSEITNKWEADPPAVVLLERSPLSDRIFAENCRDTGIMHPMEAAIYDRWWSGLIDYIEGSKPDAIIYLRASPEVCRTRMRERDRPEERANEADTDEPDELLGYLRDLHARHEEWLGGIEARVPADGAPADERVIPLDSRYGLPVLTIDANLNFRDDPLVRDALAKKIADFVERI